MGQYLSLKSNQIKSINQSKQDPLGSWPEAGLGGWQPHGRREYIQRKRRGGVMGRGSRLPLGIAAVTTTHVKINSGPDRIEIHFPFTPLLAHIWIQWLSSKQ